MKNKNKRRSDYLSNRIKVLNSFNKLMNKKGRLPNISEISRDSGVHRKTVSRHMENYSSDKYMQEFRILTEEVLISLYNKAKEGKAPEVKLWMQLVENWKETQGLKHSGKVKFEKINFVL